MTNEYGDIAVHHSSAVRTRGRIVLRSSLPVRRHGVVSVLRTIFAVVSFLYNGILQACFLRVCLTNNGRAAMIIGY